MRCFKIKKIMIVILIVLLVSISGCGDDPECITDDDCSSIQKCETAYCYMGECQTTTTKDCCGNDVCEDEENECTCDEDCGECGGVISILNSRGKEIESTYLEYLCNAEDECVASYDETEQKQTEFFYEFSENYFTFNIYVKYDIPFDKEISFFDVEITLKDYDKDKIKFPIRFNEIRILEDDTVIGRKSETLVFDAIGKKLTSKVPITYMLSQPEEEKKLTISFDYEYIPLKEVDDELVAQETERKTDDFKVSDEVTIIDTSLVKKDE